MQVYALFLRQWLLCICRRWCTTILGQQRSRASFIVFVFSYIVWKMFGNEASIWKFMKIKELVYYPASPFKFFFYLNVICGLEMREAMYSTVNYTLFEGKVSQDLRENVRFCSWFIDFCRTILFNNFLDRDQHKPIQFVQIPEILICEHAI